jgi:beta-N-acetylhexosaminidase
MSARITNLDDLIGETLVFGIPGTKVRPEDVRLFKETRAGGLILYRINFESPAQTKKLVRDLEEALGRRLLVTVDHEGGRVVMFGAGATVFPDNLAFGRAAGARDTARQGGIEARELRRLGVDVDFAPTVDVLTGAYSPNIGIRSYGADPARVAALAAARIKAMQAGGVSACAKHFPGLGPATLDPHLELPLIDVGWPELRRSHLAPFRAAMKAGVDIVMSSHPVYPRLDPGVPATFSKKLIGGLLRKELEYEGVISSDDLEMGALKHFGGAGRSAVLAARAGHDLLLCCHRADLQRDVFRKLRAAYKSGALSVRELEKSVERIEKIRRRDRPRFEGGAPRAEAAGKSLSRRVARGAVEVRGTPAVKGADSLCVIFPRLSEVADKIMVEPALRREEAFLRRATARFKGRKRFAIVPLDPAPADVRRAVTTAWGAEATVFFCYEAHMMPGCKALLDALQREVPRLTVVLMRTPYDRAFIRPSVPTVTAFGYREEALKACLERLFRP